MVGVMMKMKTVDECKGDGGGGGGASAEIVNFFFFCFLTTLVTLLTASISAQEFEWVLLLLL